MIFKRLAKDTVAYGLGEMLGRLVTFISFPIIAHAISVSDFGVLDLMLTSGTLVGIFMACGLNNAISRFYWDEETTLEERPSLISTGLFLQVIFGCTLSLIALCSMPFIYAELKENYELSFSLTALISLAVMIPVLQWLQYMRDILRLHLKPWRFTFMSVYAKTIAAVMGVSAILFFKAGIDGYLFAQALAAIMVLPLSIWFVKKDLTLAISVKWIKILLHYGTPFIYVGIAYWIFGSIDRWMLASISSVEETGLYSIAFRFSALVLFVSMAFGQAWSPNAIKIKADNPDTYREIYVKVLLLLVYFMLIIGGGVALFSKEIIYIVLPGEYGGAALPMAILCFTVVIQSTQQITGIGISLEKKTKIFGYMAWITAAINVALNLLLIPSFGASGAAMATLLSYCALTGGYSYFTQRIHPLPFSIGKIAWLVFLGGLIALFIQQTNSLELSWTVAIIKLIVLISAAVLGAFIFKEDILMLKKRIALLG